MVLEKIFLTGGSGTLGTEFLKRQFDYNIEFVAPTSNECDISDFKSVLEFLKNSKCTSILHCAAITSVTKIEKDATEACLINVLGTWNMIRASLLLNKKLVFISTDYVFDGRQGNYKINDPINPISKYAKTKASAELIARCFENTLIIRTSFFGKQFPYDKAVVDQYSTKDYVDIIAPLILKELKRDNLGIVHIGTSRSSTYDKAIKRNPSVKKVSLKDIDFKIPRDVSLYLGE